MLACEGPLLSSVGGDGWTHARNIPSKCTQASLLEEIDSEGFTGLSPVLVGNCSGFI